MFIEAELTARTEHPAKLGERPALIGHRAQHPHTTTTRRATRLSPLPEVVAVFLARERTAASRVGSCRDVQRLIGRIVAAAPIGQFVVCSCD
jgi:hypothetical protein